MCDCLAFPLPHLWKNTLIDSPGICAHYYAPHKGLNYIIKTIQKALFSTLANTPVIKSCGV